MRGEHSKSDLVIVVTRLHAPRGAQHDEYETDWCDPGGGLKPDDAFLFDFDFEDRHHQLVLVHGYQKLLEKASQLGGFVQDLLTERKVELEDFRRVWLFVHGRKEELERYTVGDFDALRRNRSDHFVMREYGGDDNTPGPVKLVETVMSEPPAVPGEVADGIARCLDPYPRQQVSLILLHELLLRIHLDLDVVPRIARREEADELTRSLREAVLEFTQLYETHLIGKLLDGSVPLSGELVDLHNERLGMIWSRLQSDEDFDLRKLGIREGEFEPVCGELADELDRLLEESSEKRRGNVTPAGGGREAP